MIFIIFDIHISRILFQAKLALDFSKQSFLDRDTNTVYQRYFQPNRFKVVTPCRNYNL